MRSPVFQMIPGTSTTLEVTPLLYMIVEHFKKGDPAPIYERFRQRGGPLGVGFLSGQHLGPRRANLLRRVMPDKVVLQPILLRAGPLVGRRFHDAGNFLAPMQRLGDFLGMQRAAIEPQLVDAARE